MIRGRIGDSANSRRDFIRGLTGALPLGLPLIAKAAPKWNVLFFAVDDLRPQLGCFGDRLAHTPNIDALAAHGTIFRHTYCHQALCGPSRASLLTGLRPDTIRVYDLSTRFRDAVPDAVTLPQLFKQNGYFTQNVGKVFHGAEVMLDAASWSVPEKLHMVTKHDQYVLEKNKDPKDEWRKTSSTECEDVPDSAYIDGRIAEAGVAALREIKDKPFFLAVGFNKPHLPFAAPRRYWNLFDRRKFPMPANPHRPQDCPPFAITKYSELRSYDDVVDDGPIPEEKIREVLHGYYAATAYTDANIGKVVSELKQLGLGEKTIIVLWADHGWHLGELDYWGKTTNYEVATRVPLLISVPGKRRQASDALLEYVDVYPTLAELCGLAAPSRLEGKSFARLLDNAALPGKQAAYSQYPRRDASTGNQPLMGYTMRTLRYRYTEWLASDLSVRARELYDHQTDPHESRNVAMLAANGETVGSLHATMHRDLSLKASKEKN
jgi:iduronate 2-sulfatase